MKTVAIAVAAVLLGTAASAQFVKGNEAVSIGADGVRKVQTPPVPRTAVKPCAASMGCKAGPWHMVETAEGLRECTEPFARPSTCRPSTFGSEKAARVWVVRQESRWLWCQRPTLDSKCVDMNARPPLNLPQSAVQ
jgi:hypothetical protein